MGLNATDVMPIIRVIICFVFMYLRSVLRCFPTIARPWDFTVLLESRFLVSPLGEKRETLPAREDVLQSR